MKTALFALVILVTAVTVCSTKRNRKHFCKLPPIPRNAAVRYRKFHGKNFTKIGSKIVYSCIKGFFRHGARWIKCQKNGKWSNIPPVCKGKHFCKLPPVPENAKVRYGNFHGKNFTKIGSKIVYSCIKGFFRHGARWIKCQKNGKWSNIPPVCKVGRCNKPYGLKFLRNGNYITDNENFEYMSTIKIVCNQGYSVFTNSPDAMTCTQNRYGQMVWQSPYVPRCYRVHPVIISAKENKGKHFCKLPPVPGNAKVRYRRFHYKKFTKIGSKIVYSCIKGFFRHGARWIKCQKNGKWSNIPAVCKDGKIIISPRNETVSPTSSLLRTGPINLDSTNGLDVIFMIESSSRIGKGNFRLALKFTKFLIDKFGVDYGASGTRIAAITYNTRAYLVYNLGDPDVDTVAKAKAETSKIRYLGGGTAMRSALMLIRNVVAIDKGRATALIIITDGKYTVEGNPIDIAYELRRNYGIKICAVGIGTSINKRELRLLVGQEHKEHVFQLEKFDEFQDIFEKLTYRDYSPCGEGHIKTRGRILGGAEVKESSWPWMVAIYRLEGETYKSMCGGSFIREDMILTAAHCLEDFSGGRRKPRRHENQYRIISGVTKIKRTLAEPRKFDWVERLGLQLKAIHVHPNFTFGEYNQQDYDNDIALLQLQEPVMWSARVRPICLPRPENFLRDYNTKLNRPYGYVSGWGYTSKGNLTLPEKLRIVALGVNNNKTCEDPEFEEKLMFCASDGDGKTGVCGGDGGGPFAIPLRTGEDKIKSRYYIMGIVSWAVGGCGDSGFYEYYTRVTNYLNWIEKVMGQSAI